MTPLQFVTRQRITRAQQLIRETSRSLIEVALKWATPARAISRKSSGACGRHADGVRSHFRFSAGLRQ